MNRKDFILGGAALLGAGAYASPVRSLIGGRVFDTVEKSMPTTQDYVQDGLLAMWDGIESEFNTSESSSEWVDLVSGISLLSRPSDTALFEKAEDHIHFPNGASAYCDIVGLASAMSNKTYTIEMVVRKEFVVRAYMLALANRDEVSYGGSASYLETGVNNVVGTNEVNATPPSYGNIWQWSYGREGSRRTLFPNNKRNVIDQRSTTTAWSTNRLYLNTSQVRESSSLSARCKTDGNYYHLRVYSRYLDAEEAQHNYSIDKSRFNLP